MDTHSKQITQVSELLQRLTQGPQPVASVELAEPMLQGLGLAIADGLVQLPNDTELLDQQAIRSSLSVAAANWLRELNVFPAIDSTNTWQMQQVSKRDIDGVVALAECQVAGRGRRGRQWQSPLGSNLALSLGFSLKRPLVELGGLSLVVGLAAIDALDPDGSLGIQLKWPNDLLVDGQKLSGILVEVAVRGDAAQVCAGIGVNWCIPAAIRSAIDQPIADMAQLGSPLGRNSGAGRLISSISEFVRRFAEHGFADMVPHYDALHWLHGRDCTVLRPQGDIQGRVLGVTAGGLLRLETESGEQEFGSGEVSVRRS